jgi:hypothetical protein
MVQIRSELSCLVIAQSESMVRSPATVAVSRASLGFWSMKAARSFDLFVGNPTGIEPRHRSTGVTHLVANDRRNNPGKFPTAVAAPPEGLQPCFLKQCAAEKKNRNWPEQRAQDRRPKELNPINARVFECFGLKNLAQQFADTFASRRVGIRPKRLDGPYYFTICFTTAEIFVLKFRSPEYPAVMECVPTASVLVVNLA